MERATHTDRYGKSDWIDVNALKKSVNETYMTQMANLPVLDKLMDEEALEAMDKLNEEFTTRIGICPAGAPTSDAVLTWGHRSGVIMQEQKKAIKAFKIAWINKQLKSTWGAWLSSFFSNPGASPCGPLVGSHQLPH